ncbi:mrc1 domain-containing protein [Pyrenophora tritici-repentis]|nr:mrc1 domain-containing protein [Pyrenophora tritici-repentis]
MSSTNGSPTTTSMRTSPARGTDASTKPRPKLLAALRKRTSDSSESEAESDNGSSTSEDEAPITKPAEKASAKPLTMSRLQIDDNETNEDESDGEDAYELMKKRLAASKTSASVQLAPQEAPPETPIVATIESSEDEDKMPVRANVRKPIAERTNTVSPRASPSPGMRSRRSSPGLFVTPGPSPAKKQPRRSADAGSESDESSRSTHDADLQERVRRIREERLAKQREEEAGQVKPKKTARRQEDEDSHSDGENSRRLTQHAKPTRRAGKKAMEAMARDQQRISRNMQLTHQAKTKKRFTTQDLFKKFNYNAPNAEPIALPTPEPSSALASSDAEANQIRDTPPASPPREEAALQTMTASVDQQTLIAPPDNQDHAKVDKGKGRAPEFQHLPAHPWMKQTEPVMVQNARVDMKNTSEDAMVELSDSDDEPRVEQPKSRFPVFDRLPTKKQDNVGTHVTLRALAQISKSPQRSKKGQKSVTRAEMELSLALKARQQTARAREERIADLVKRGLKPETDEEREKRQVEIDDMVALLEKQRQEDLELAKMERKEAKKNGETIDDLPSSDEEDGDYVASGDEDAAQGEDENQEDAEVELSGSEDEDLADADDGEATEVDEANDLIDGMADEDHADEDVDMEDDQIDIPVRRQTVNRARKRVIDDDDESDAEAPKQATPTQPATPTDAMAAFGFGKTDAGLGLTQMFAGTMAELEAGSQPVGAVDTEQDSLAFLRNLPETQPGPNFSQASDFLVPNSQSLMSPQKPSHAVVESQFSLGIDQLAKSPPALPSTQVEDFEPTQDAGFSFSRSPVGLAPPPSTIDTVMMPIAESPIKQKKGRLQRGRREEAVELSDVEEDLIATEEDESEDDIQRPPKPSKHAFMKMQQAVKKAKVVEEFNKKKSMAREAVMEQAEESEDEYAGLGGASDDEESEEDEELKEMIDHDDVKVDERQIAAFYADKTKKDDEKQLAELYKKMKSKGGLRRNGGYDGFDMSDSEDEAELRQRKKRADFQKQTNALLQDQKVKALADDEKKKAFFNTLADFADEDEYDYLNMPEKETDMDMSDSQSQSQNQSNDIPIPDSQVGDSQNLSAPNSPFKRKSTDLQKENRPPPHMRPTAALDTLARKPMTVDDVKHSISELIEDPRIVIPDSQLSDAEDDDNDDDLQTSRTTARKPIIDRLSLSRQSTVEESVSANSTALAFHAPSRSSAGTPGFRVPSLIRQATSNLSISSERSASSNSSNSANKESSGFVVNVGRNDVL